MAGQPPPVSPRAHPHVPATIVQLALEDQMEYEIVPTSSSSLIWTISVCSSLSNRSKYPTTYPIEEDAVGFLRPIWFHSGWKACGARVAHCRSWPWLSPPDLDASKGSPAAQDLPQRRCERSRGSWPASVRCAACLDQIILIDKAQDRDTVAIRDG